VRIRTDDTGRSEAELTGRDIPNRIRAKKVAVAPIGEHALDHLLVEGVADYAIFVVAPTGLIVRWNLGAEALFGYTGSEVIGRHFGLLFTPEDVATRAPERELTEALTGPTTGHDRWHVRCNGSRFWGMNTAQPLYDERGTLLGFTKIVRDLTERYMAAEALREGAEKLRALVEKTQHAALHDDLTGLANKPLFREYLTRAIARSERRPARTFAVLFFDLDGFKSANDGFGHILADQLLVQVALRIEHAIRAEDVLARVGGDEFAILAEDIHSAPDAILIAEHVLGSLRAPFKVEGTEVSMTASIGIALAPAHGSQAPTADRLLEDADLAMYEAKSRGRAQYVLFDHAMRTRATAAIQLNNDLREALRRDELRIFYQPVVDVRSRRISGFEALARWQHPERGLLLRADFRARAEETGVIVGIDRWALSKAASQLEAWHRDFDATGRLTMSVNLSGKEVAHPGLSGELRQILAETTLPPHSIAVEITEGLSTEDSERVVAVVAEMQAIGLDVHVGGFGTGRSSFMSWSPLPITALKIDPSFVSSMQSDRKNVAIVQAMLAFAHSLGLKCIAEGVETEDQLAILTELGCDEAQGALFSEPVTPEAARTLLVSSWNGAGALGVKAAS
jgi:diguanylate cyclase (GGDEF)-like protein/PAS domain S-box-containing protein